MLVKKEGFFIDTNLNFYKRKRLLGKNLKAMVEVIRVQFLI
jgi:hypothetical protein